MQAVVVTVVLLAIGVGFPAAVWYVGRRFRPPGPALLAADLFAFSRHHRLSPTDIRLIKQAVQTGSRLEQPRLRPLAVEHAWALLQEASRQQDAALRSFRRAGPWLVLAVLALVGWVRLPAPNLVALLFWVVPLLVDRRRLRRLRQAVRANEEAPPSLV